jgi:hypothetical protein
MAPGERQQGADVRLGPEVLAVSDLRWPGPPFDFGDSVKLFGLLDSKGPNCLDPIDHVELLQHFTHDERLVPLKLEAAATRHSHVIAHGPDPKRRSALCRAPRQQRDSFCLGALRALRDSLELYQPPVEPFIAWVDMW